MTQKKAPAKKTSPAKAKTSNKKVRTVKGDTRTIHLLVKENPKRPGTKAHERFGLFREGMTVAEWLAAGGIRAGIKYNVDRGYIELKGK